jgi:hypothetical protein
MMRARIDGLAGKEMTMREKLPPEIAAFEAKEFDKDHADFVRTVTTFLGLHKSCPFKVCRRAHACATRNVVCYQVLEEHMRPIMFSVISRDWFRAVARGEQIDVAPAAEGDMRRNIAWEEREIAKIMAGEYGSDEELTPHQLWLKRLALDEPRRPEARTFTEEELWPTPPLPPETEESLSGVAPRSGDGGGEPQN